MCGIAGQLRHDGRPVDPGLVERMSALEHRGPDARGSHVDGPVGLGIQRLAVIDIEHGDQPISNEDGSVVVVFNGEIYNYRELRAELAAGGHRFRTDGDTEVIVHLYEEHGVDCVEHAARHVRLRALGRAAAGACSSPATASARSRSSTPCATARSRFASELRALLAGPRDRRATSTRRRSTATSPTATCRRRSAPSPRVRKLPPGRRRWSAQDGRVALERYWQLDYGPQARRVDEPRSCCERIREELRAATRRRLVADVPLGAFLSGGIDSSAVVAAMARVPQRARARPSRSASTTSRFDELPHARAVAELFGTDHEEFDVRPDAIEIVPQLVRHYGEPFADSSAIPTFYLAELTRRHVTVALNGDGGDEIFAGYTRYVANALAARLDAAPGAAAPRPPRAVAGRLPRAATAPSASQPARRLAGALALDAGRATRATSRCFDAAQRGALYTPDVPRRALGAGRTPPSAIATRAGRRPRGRRARPHARGRQRAPTCPTT